jgi:hypothetical protein
MPATSEIPLRGLISLRPTHSRARATYTKAASGEASVQISLPSSGRQGCRRSAPPHALLAKG